MNINSTQQVPSLQYTQQPSKTMLLSFNRSFDSDHQANDDYHYPPLISQSFEKTIASEFQLYQSLGAELNNLQMRIKQFNEEIIITACEERKFSRTLEGKWKKQKQEIDVFIKTVTFQDSEKQLSQERKTKILKNEILLQLYAFQHLPQNVVRILGWLPFEEDPNYGGSIIMEMGKCDLDRAVKGILKEANYQHYIDQIVKIGMTLRLIHVTHQDLKLGQFIYFEEDETIKLADFGSAFYEGTLIEQQSDLQNLWQPTTPAYHSPQFYQLWVNQGFTIVNYSLYKNENRMKEFYCYICYKIDSYALGLIILRILFPNYHTYALKQMLTVISSQDLKQDLQIITEQYEQPDCQENDIKDLKERTQNFKKLLQQSNLSLNYSTTSQFLYPDPIQVQMPIINVLKLVDFDFLERKNISQLFLNSPKRKHDYNAYFKHLLHAYEDKNIVVAYKFEEIYEIVKSYKVLHPKYELMEFGQKGILFYPDGQEEFKYEEGYNYIEAIYNSIRALGVEQYAGQPLNFQNFILFLAEKEIISPDVGTIAASLKYYLKRVFQIDSWLFRDCLSYPNPDPYENNRLFLNESQQEQILIKMNDLLSQGCILLIALNEYQNYQRLINQTYFVREIDVKEKMLKTHCGVEKKERYFSLTKDTLYHIRLFLRVVE